MFALLLVTLASKVEVRTCIGVCADQAAATPACCSTPTAADAAASCCGCCEVPSDRQPTPDDDDDDRGCCVTIDFDVDQAPASDPCKVRMAAPIVCWVEPLPRPAARVVEAARPCHYDRGPPRIDRQTALRATQVLLI